MRKIIFFAVIILLFGITGYVYWFYYKVYGEGIRDGKLLRFSRRGQIFKTYEGQIQYGVGTIGAGNYNPNYFYFSVTDEKVADSLEKCLGKVVNVHYVQYMRSLPWRGESYKDRDAGSSQSIVDKVIDVQNTPGY